MNNSILFRLKVAYISFGIFMGVVFPFYANFFVNWKDGMLLWFTIGSIGAGITMGLVVSVITKKILVQPLQNISVIATAISQNDLSKRCDIESQDLIGDIINSFDLMVTNLSALILELQNHALTIQTSVSEVSSIAVDSTQSSSMQYTEVQRIQASIKQLQEAISVVADNSSIAMTLSNETIDNVALGSQFVDETMSAVQDLADNIQLATSTITKLKDETDSIGFVTQAINDISEQTNLLALNAAIEAARAGEQGRGFAVVADEVRTLATRTKESTSEIQNIIERLQKGALLAVDLMGKSTVLASEGVKSISSTGERFSLVTETMSQMNNKNQQVKHSVQEQLESITDIHKNIDNVGVLTSENQKGSLGSSTESLKLKLLVKTLVQGFDSFKLSEKSALSSTHSDFK